MAEEGFPAVTDPVGRVRHCLSEAGCAAGIVHTDETIFTVLDASSAVGAPPQEILKSLLLSVEDSEGGSRVAIALMSGVNKLHDKKAKRALAARKVRMATAEVIFEYSGFAPGGVPPVGYENQPEALLDEDLFLYETVWAAAGTDHDFFPISPPELLRITGGRRADIKK